MRMLSRSSACCHSEAAFARAQRALPMLFWSMEPLSPPAVARADTEATPADCLPGPVLPLGRAGHFALIDLQAKPLLVPYRPQFRPDYALLVAGA